jgi:hypothetical protein
MTKSSEYVPVEVPRSFWLLMLQYNVTEIVWVFFAFGNAVFWGTVGERVC